MGLGINTGTITRSVITTLNSDANDVMGLNVVAWKYPETRFVSGSLLTVESNHFAVLKSRGAILDIYDTGQYALKTPDKPLVGSIVQGFFGGGSDANPWQMEVIYIQRSKLKVTNKGLATSREMAEMMYTVEYYIHIDSKEDAQKLITHMPFAGNAILTEEVAGYAGPVIEQSVNQIVQVTPMENINEHIHDITELCKNHLTAFLGVYGITLNDLKILILPRDERMRELISFQAIGLNPREAIQYYLALKMAEKGLVSAPNAAVAAPFQIGSSTLGTWDAKSVTDMPGGTGNV
mgnify:CR=1 FL=1